MKSEPPPTPSVKGEKETTDSEKVKSGKKKKLIRKKKTSRTIPDIEDFPFPANFQPVLDGISEMRRERDAPVDTVGCERLANPDAAPIDQRFQHLVSLMLSSMTKDPTTAAAMVKLHQKWKTGLTVENVRKASFEDINECINKVGFHNRKTE